MDELAIIRRHYAESLAFRVGLRLGPLVDAFASVPRERFLGPGPWQIMHRASYRPTPDADPRHVYHDVLVGLIPERQLNNGQPSFLASLIEATQLAAGEHVVHLGCGVGYYSAVMAEVVGPTGRVTAIEAEPELAARAVDNLADRQNVLVRQGDGMQEDFAQADVVLVNFGVTHPLRRWAERLGPGGRLLVPITVAAGIGAVLRFQRKERGVSASFVSPTQIFSSVSGRDAALESKLAARFATGQMSAAAVASLRIDAHDENDTCWLHAEDACLSTRSLEPPGPLDAYAGTFRVGPGVDVVFRVEDGALHVQSPAGAGPLTPRGEDSFAGPGATRMQFTRDASGLAMAVTIDAGGMTYQGRRR